jgi:hypothetical protein
MGWVVNATPRSLYLLERDPLHIIQEAGWAPGGVWKISNATGLDPRTSQTVAGRYTDYTIPVHSGCCARSN